MKADELARALGVNPKELVNFLTQRRLTRNPQAPLNANTERLVRQHFAGSLASHGDNGMPKQVQLPASLSVKELGEYIKVGAVDILKELMRNGVMVNINHQIDFDTAAIVSDSFGVQALPLQEDDVVAVEEIGRGDEVTVKVTTRESLFSISNEDPRNLRSRPPVVTVMGHVDHGKTSILDAIRQTRVAMGEAGGITQRIGAYVIHRGERSVVFMDTPGHEAFTAMRARGAQVTDLALLVVAADDGVKPQTIEAISHARAAKVPIVVAINKIDKDGSNVDRVHQDLAGQGIVVSEYQGDVECVHVSAKQMIGLDNLLDTILIVTELMDLKANPDRAAVGTVIDAHLERGRGAVATVLVQNGSLHVGDFFACGPISGRVRTLLDDHGRKVRTASPATPAVVTGLPEVPNAGEIFQVMPSDRAARSLALTRAMAHRAEAAKGQVRTISLADFTTKIQAGELRELNVVLKADSHGSLEAVRGSLQRISDPEVKLKIVADAVGAVTESDVMLASASGAVIVGFNIRVDPLVSRMSERERVEIRTYEVIYRLTEDLERAVRGLKEPVYKEVWEGRAEVVMPIRIPRLGVIAGSRVEEGRISRGSVVRVFRSAQQLAEGRVSSLKHFKEDAREMVAGQECGVGVEGFAAFEPGDRLESYRLELQEAG